MRESAVARLAGFLFRPRLKKTVNGKTTWCRVPRRLYWGGGIVGINVLMPV